MKIDESKLRRQLLSISKWLRTGANGTLEAATGVGKTMVSIIAIWLIQRTIEEMPIWIKPFLTQFNLKPGGNKEAKIVVIVPSLILQDDWIRDKQVFDKKGNTVKDFGHIIKHDLKNVDVYVINSFIKSEYEYDFIVLDEIHNYAATTFRAVFDVCKYRWVLGLTATLKRGDGNEEILKRYAPVYDTISITEAKKEGWVSNYIIYNLELVLSEPERARYDKEDTTYNNILSTIFDSNHEIMKKVATGDQSTRYANASKWASYKGWNRYMPQDHMFSPKKILSAAAICNNAHIRRNELLYDNTTKREATIALAKKFNHKKIISFSERATFADSVAEWMGEDARAYHSSLKTIERIVEGKVKKIGIKRQKDEAVNLFTEGQIHLLSTVKALDEGADIPAVDMCIIASYNSTSRQDKQRRGRGIRFVKDKVALIVKLVIKDSQDEVWARSGQQGERVIKVKSIDEIRDPTESNPSKFTSKGNTRTKNSDKRSNSDIDRAERDKSIYG